MINIATIAETVPGYTARVRYSNLVPARTPAPMVAKLNATTGKILHAPEFKERFASDCGEVIATPPKEHTDFPKAETSRRGKVVKDANVRAE